MSDNQPVVIRPAEVPLSQDNVSAPHTTTRQSSRWRSLALLVCGAIAMVAALVWVFLILPDSLQQNPTSAGGIGSTIHSAAATTSETPDRANAADGTANNTQISAPFRDLQLKRAKEQAQTQLSKFVELQIRLEEDMQIGQWGQVRYDKVKDLATAGDEQFVNREFEQALGSYSNARADLEALAQSGNLIYRDSVAAGLTALLSFNQPLAEREFAQALVIKPQDPAALAGAARANNLPEVQRLLRRANQLARRGDIEAAVTTYNEAQKLDPLTPNIDTALAELTAARADLDYENHLSKGFAALERGQHTRARSAFNAALAIRSEDAIAIGGLQQITQDTEVKGINALRRKATAAVVSEQWQLALTTYDAALKIDSALKFAQAGRRDTRARLRYVKGMATIIKQRNRLSDDNKMAQAQKLLTEAAALPSGGPAWDAQLATASDLLRAYQKPVAVTLTSDNATEVVVYKVGRLGRFAKHELELRPGAYTIVGSRNGCRDVRKEVVVAAQMPPIEIRCEQKF